MSEFSAENQINLKDKMLIKTTFDEDLGKPTE